VGGDESVTRWRRTVGTISSPAAAVEVVGTGRGGHFDSLADVFRQIAHDERVHKLESEALAKEPRFH
jgi:hypothetical protein